MKYIILKKFFFKTLRPYFLEICIAFNSRSIRVKVSFLCVSPFKISFKLFLNIFKDFYVAKGIIYGIKVLDLWLRVFDLKFFYSNILDLYLGRDDISETIILLSLIVIMWVHDLSSDTIHSLQPSHKQCNFIFGKSTNFSSLHQQHINTMPDD